MSVYKNGNTIVEIKDDGTKIRYVPDDQIAHPIFPESIDLKITNRCSMGCPMCHEKSYPDGAHADLNNPILDTLHPFTELAIGGGNPMSHPDLKDFLLRMKRKQVICNITVHWKTFCEQYETLKHYTEEKMIYGLGVSVNEDIPDDVIELFKEFKHLVVHVIIGVADFKLIQKLYDNNLNILLLGYKDFGKGKDYCIENHAEIDMKIIEIATNLPSMVNHFRAVSFDNLAINQLELNKVLKPEAFKQMYMGNDGEYTMYIDFVEKRFAKSSTEEYRPEICGNSIDELFSYVREKCAV